MQVQRNRRELDEAFGRGQGGPVIGCPLWLLVG